MFRIGNQKIISIGPRKYGSFNGLIMRADPGLHEQVAQEVKRVMPQGGRILDFGCGQGALSLRLKVMGYEVLAVDTNVSDFQAHGQVEFQPLNFNNPAEVQAFYLKFSESFDLVMGIEVIEHVENPWEYVRNLKSLVKPGGHILVTTPNITSWYHRMVFLFTATFPTFRDPDEMGHINPISAWELKVIADKTNLKDIRIVPAGELALLWLSGSIPRMALNFLFLPIYPIVRGIKLGWCVMMTARKPLP
jgi:SAM-dependent methyltransferase